MPFESRNFRLHRIVTPPRVGKIFQAIPITCSQLQLLLLVTTKYPAISIFVFDMMILHGILIIKKRVLPPPLGKPDCAGE